LAKRCLADASTNQGLAMSAFQVECRSHSGEGKTKASILYGFNDARPA
jgi:hypothetical protein